MSNHPKSKEVIESLTIHLTNVRTYRSSTHEIQQLLVMCHTWKAVTTYLFKTSREEEVIIDKTSLSTYPKSKEVRKSFTTQKLTYYLQESKARELPTKCLLTRCRPSKVSDVERWTPSWRKGSYSLTRQVQEIRGRWRACRAMSSLQEDRKHGVEHLVATNPFKTSTEEEGQIKTRPTVNLPRIERNERKLHITATGNSLLLLTEAQSLRTLCKCSLTRCRPSMVVMKRSWSPSWSQSSISLTRHVQEIRGRRAAMRRLAGRKEQRDGLETPCGHHLSKEAEAFGGTGPASWARCRNVARAWDPARLPCPACRGKDGWATCDRPSSRAPG